MKVKKLFSSISILLSMGVLLSSAAFASNQNDSLLSAEELEAKAVVEQLKQEMEQAEVMALDEVADLPLDEEEQQLYDGYLEYIAANDLPDTYESIVSYSESANVPRATVTVAVVRAAGNTAATAAGVAGYKMVKETFSHSLQDNPSDLTWNAGTTYSMIMKNSPDYADLLSYIKGELDTTSASYWSEDASMAFDTPKDVYLSLHYVDYLAAAEKVSGKWTIYVRFFDTYDFDYDNSEYPSGIVTWANNYAYEAQQLGAVVPYDIIAYTKDIYKP